MNDPQVAPKYSLKTDVSLTAGDEGSRLHTVLLVVLLVWLLVGAAYRGTITTESGIAGLDFGAFYHAAERLNHGQPLYVTHLIDGRGGALYVYSPLLALLLRPLAHLSFATAMRPWFFVNAACLILGVLLYGKAARLTVRSASLLCILLLTSFRFWDSTMDFALGQSDFLLLAMIGGMLWADSRGLWRLLASLIALAALVKVWALGLLLYPLLCRRWRTVLFSLAVFTLAQVALFSLVGWHELPGYWECMQEAKSAGEGNAVMNSIVGFAALHFRRNPLVDPLLNSSLAYAAFVAAGGAALMWGFTVLWRILKAPTPMQARLAFALVLASFLLLMPTYENGYFVFCLPLFWVFFASPDAETTPGARVALAGGILIYLVFSRGWPIYAPFPLALHHGIRSLFVSMEFFGTVALWSLGMYALNKSALAVKGQVSLAPKILSGLSF